MEQMQPRSIRVATFLGLALVGAALLLDAGPFLDRVHAASLIDREDLESIWASINALDTGYTIAAIVGVLFISGAGLPIPEDIPLAFTGILLSLPQTASAAFTEICCPAMERAKV